MDSYYEKYIRDIVPKIKEMDILIKSSERISVREMAEVIGLRERELSEIMHFLGIESITRDNVIQIIKNSPDAVCNLITREIQCGMSEYYFPQQIAYIYGIEKSKVEKAFRILGIKKAKAFQLEQIFCFI